MSSFQNLPKKEGKNRDYIELAYSQLKQLVSYSWLWYFSPNLCRQFLTKVRAQPRRRRVAAQRHGHGPSRGGERQRGVQRAGNAFDGHLAYLPTHLSRSLTMVFMALVTLLLAQRLVIEFEYLAYIAWLYRLTQKFTSRKVC